MSLLQLKKNVCEKEIDELLFADDEGFIHENKDDLQDHIINSVE
jgi:hypothetical protein